MKIVAILGFVLATIGALVGLTMLSDIFSFVNFYGREMGIREVFNLLWWATVLLTFFLSAILYVVADRAKKMA